MGPTGVCSCVALCELPRRLSRARVALPSPLLAAATRALAALRISGHTSRADRRPPAVVVVAVVVARGIG